jgi:hypothetical protein
MRAEIIQDASILVPNQEHLNFTESADVLKKGTIVYGEEKLVEGKRRGEKFTYRLFLTNNKQLIYLKNIKPMEVTEVTLGADASPSATVVKVPEGKKLLTKNVMLYTALGLGVGFGYSKYAKADKKKTIIYTLVGGAIGFGIAKWVEKRKAVIVKPSK